MGFYIKKREIILMGKIKTLIKKIMPRRYYGTISYLYNRLFSFIQGSRKIKKLHEFDYWKRRKTNEGILTNNHYKYFYTTHFELKESFFNGKKILDIGCGPRGSLEWADMASERVGLDPLVPVYHKLGINTHKMAYVSARSEKIPFPDRYFDVVSSFNSLDHVDDINLTVKEIIRVITPGGLFLLLTDVGHDPTVCEPIVLSWDIVSKFMPSLKLVEEKHYEKSENGMYESIKANIPFDYLNRTKRYGILSAKFIKV